MSEASKISSGYSKPPKDVLDVMRAPSLSVPHVSPTSDRMIMVQWQKHKSIERMANPYLRLAGLRVEPHNHSRRDTKMGYGILPCASGYNLVNIADGTQIEIKLPENGYPGPPVWSADGKLFAFRNITVKEVEIWIGDGQTGVVRRVPDARLNPMLDNSLQWMPDQRTVLVKLVPTQMDPPPSKPAALAGPKIQETHGESGQSSTYEFRDTLKSPHDEDLFDYYAASQLAFVDAASLAVQHVGVVDNYWGLDPAPDGKHLLVTVIQKPYSYVTTYNRFPHIVEVWTIVNGSNAATQNIASLPLADRIPLDGVRLGPRKFSWRANVPATLIWAEALDGGDWAVDVPARDKIMMSQAPFSAPPKEVTRVEHRFDNIQWGERPELAILMEYDLNKHWYRSFIINIDEPESSRRSLWDLSMHEKYNNPGKPVHRRLLNGAKVMHQEGNSIFLAGDGSSPDGDRPFLDELDLKSLKSRRLFRCPKSIYEKFLGFDKSDTKSFLTWRQSPNDPPNLFRRTLLTSIEAPDGEATYASESLAITHLPDPAPIIRQIKKRLVKYKRDDGLDLSFQLFTPPGYQAGTRVPTILHAYPRDYADKSTAGQISGSDSRFITLHQYRYLLLAGYAVINEVSFPIIGDPKKAYDTYLEQLVANAKAAVDEVVRLGVADPDKICVTGHSHGALMTANLLAHSNLFQAGVATSGAYNRSLTPFGFQNERRSVWEAPEIYLKVSPFFAANNIKTPLLLMHGEDDANPGTPPAGSRMFYEGIRGNGGITRLVMLPHEPHRYEAQETNEQVVYEMLNWFDKYVKKSH
jgi:dipeptidyl aminopeptidase/acylaminoacyl peptidase